MGKQKPIRNPQPLGEIPTCKKLAEMLMMFGDRPLMSGSTCFAITGFTVRPDGMISTTAKPINTEEAKGKWNFFDYLHAMQEKTDITGRPIRKNPAGFPSCGMEVQK